MPVSPVFLVTQQKEALRVTNSAQGKQTEAGLWKVAFDYGYTKGTTVDWWFPTQEEAELFTPGDIITPLKLLELLKSSTPYIAQSIEKSRIAGAVNRYTDRPELVDSWKVGFADQHGDRYTDWSFPTELEANRYAKGKSYYAQDMIGTLPADPVPTTLDALSGALRFAFTTAKDARQAREDYEAAKAEKLRLEKEAKDELNAQLKAEKEAAAKKAAEAAAAKKAYEAKRAAEANAAYEAAKAAKERSDYLNRAITVKRAAGTGPYDIKTESWQITNGGSAGYYGGVYYARGAFPLTNGIYAGTFVAG